MISPSKIEPFLGKENLNLAKSSFISLLVLFVPTSDKFSCCSILCMYVSHKLRIMQEKFIELVF